MNSPDFSAISKSGFSDYEAIPIEKVYASDAHSSECISLIRRGFSEGAFDIQLHGSQHLNVSAWMKAGKAGDHDVMRSCSYGLVSTGSMYSPENPFAFLDELGASNEQDALQIADSLRESLVRMNDLFGSRGTALTPSCGVRSPFYKTIEERFNYTKGAFIEFKRDANGVYRKMIMTKSRAARYKCLVRNCTFEPSWNEAAANDCLADIEFAFAHSRPAIVSTHRINYSSRLSEKNRERSLKQLRSLLESVLKRYPNVRFVTTEEIAKDWLKGS